MHSVQVERLLGPEILHEVVFIIQMPHLVNTLLVEKALGIFPVEDLDRYIFLGIPQRAFVNAPESTFAQNLLKLQSGKVVLRRGWRGRDLRYQEGSFGLQLKLSFSGGSVFEAAALRGWLETRRGRICGNFWFLLVVQPEKKIIMHFNVKVSGVKKRVYVTYLHRIRAKARVTNIRARMTAMRNVTKEWSLDSSPTKKMTKWRVNFMWRRKIRKRITE